jgi:hypothetical protein
MAKTSPPVSMINMQLYNPPYALWSIWKELSLLNRMLILILGVVFAYCVLYTVKTILVVRSARGGSNENLALARDRVAALAIGYATLRQVIGAAFYLFGLVLFLGFENVASVLSDSKEPIGFFILDNFLLQSAFAANVFFIFLLLHLVRWSGNVALDRFSRRLSRQPVSEGFSGDASANVCS